MSTDPPQTPSNVLQPTIEQQIDRIKMPNYSFIKNSLIRYIYAGDLLSVKYMMKFCNNMPEIMKEEVLSAAAAKGIFSIFYYVERRFTFSIDCVLYAISSNNINIVKYLLETYTDINYINKVGFLRAASSHGYLDMVKLLISYDCDPYDKYVLERSAYWGHLGILQYIYELSCSQVETKYLKNTLHCNCFQQSNRRCNCFQQSNRRCNCFQH